AYVGGLKMRALLFCLLTTFLLCNVGHALAAGAAKCDAFVKASDAAYAVAHNSPGNCGLNPNDPRWKYPPSKDSEYRRFCSGAEDFTIDQMMQQLIDVTARCQTCLGRAAQCADQDRQAAKFHCALKSNGFCSDIAEGSPYRNDVISGC